MVQKVRDRLIGGVIGTTSGIIVGLVLFFFGGLRTEAQAFEDLVNDKLDKEDYVIDQEYRWGQHDIRHENEAREYDRLYDQVNWLYQNEINKRTYSIPPLKEGVANE